MRKLKVLASVALAGVMAISLSACKLVEKTPEAIQKTVLAKVQDVKITKAELDERMASIDSYLAQQYGENFLTDKNAKELYLNYQKQYLDTLVTEQVLLKKATELNLVPDQETLDKEIQEKLAEIKGMYDNNEEQYQAALKASNLNDVTVLDYLKEQILMTKVLDEIFKDVNITDEKIQKHYDDNIAKYTTGPGATLAHILVADEETAKTVKAKIDEGASFEDMAKEYGTDGTASSGGSLGYYDYHTTELDADFMAGAKTLKEGEVSGPVKTQFGYHIIKATDLKTEAVVTPLDEVKEEIKTELQETEENAIYTEKLKAWKEEMKVKVYTEKLEELLEQ